MRTRTPGQRWFDSPGDFEARCDEWRWEEHDKPKPESVCFWLPPRGVRESSIEQMRREIREFIAMVAR